MKKTVIVTLVAIVTVTASGSAATRRFTRDTSIVDQPVVTDNITGLIWQGCAAGLSGEDCDAGTAVDVTWENALAYCEALEWGGRPDWRLPSRVELRSIVNNRAAGPVIDPTAFPATPSTVYWSASTYAGNTSNAWGVDFENGIVNYYEGGKHGFFHVRCVRGGP